MKNCFLNRKNTFFNNKLKKIFLIEAKILQSNDVELKKKVTFKLFKSN